MTREENIRAILECCFAGYKDEVIDSACECIYELSQEPCTDAVSREAIIYYIKGHIHEIITESGTDKNAHTNSILRALINGVETMPSVTQKSGKWIPNYYFYGIYDYTCSECEKHSKEQLEFCPKCGAKMESEE